MGWLGRGPPGELSHPPLLQPHLELPFHLNSRSGFAVTVPESFLQYIHYLRTGPKLCCQNSRVYIRRWSGPQEHL